jgi:hypothetical protein
MAKICYVEKNFRASSLVTIDQANAIIAEYAALGYDLTLRQLYYQFVSRGWLANKDTEYDRLGALISDARIAGLIDWDALIDRTRNLRKLSAWASPGDIIQSAAQSYHIDLWKGQPYHVEVWIEKDALIGVIENVCNQWDVPFFACRGYTSQSEMWAAARRLYYYQRVEKRIPLIIHLGDHDPSGIDMTRDITDRLSMFVEHDAGKSFVEVRRIALNMDQVEQYTPPPNPAKLSDSRAAGYVDQYGDDSWELDALRPDVIAQLIEDEIATVVQADKYFARRKLQGQQQRELTYAARNWDAISSEFDLPDEPDEPDPDDTESDEDS